MLTRTAKKKQWIYSVSSVMLAAPPNLLPVSRGYCLHLNHLQSPPTPRHAVPPQHEVLYRQVSLQEYKSPPTFWSYPNLTEPNKPPILHSVKHRLIFNHENLSIKTYLFCRHTPISCLSEFCLVISRKKKESPFTVGLVEYFSAEV